ncbi:MAG: hypothetical protein Q9202_003943 [Teloschistes flavicans]
MPGDWENVTYEWLIKRPGSNAQAKALMKAAYRTATQTDRETSRILIRADVHERTWAGQYMNKDAPHITVASKNPQQELRGTHTTSHGYTKDMEKHKYYVIRSSSDHREKGDDLINRENKPYWPKNLYEEPKREPQPEPPANLPFQTSSETVYDIFAHLVSNCRRQITTMSPTDPQTISEAIGNDHQALDQYADNIKSATTLEDKTKWRNQLTWALARHAISEELTMYPAMEQHLGEEGLQLTNTDREQHQAVKEDLSKLQSLSPSSPSFLPLLDRLLTDLHHHIAHESNEDIPRLEDKLSREESKALARSFERTKIITPTRSHPSAPNRPYFENFAALLAAPIDRFRDLLTAWPERAEVAENHRSVL